MWSRRLSLSLLRLSLDISYVMLLVRRRAPDVSTLTHVFAHRFLASFVSTSNLRLVPTQHPYPRPPQIPSFRA
ncbi:hypothetical protein C8T65DRAFT_633060 [Cerioporus squamosus]|nr:hypothetical protein C8T65DRAFT_633060 [Cerioporus squamosus]